jgi:hypothetical protein
LDETSAVPPPPALSGRRVLGIGALLAVALVASLRLAPEFRADSVSYFVWLRSAYFDHDLDFANEWAHWGLPEQPRTATGLRRNVHSVGPAVLWSPFYLGADLYVGATGAFPRDGYSVPYRRAAAFGTLVGVLVGAWLLGGVIAARAGPRTAAMVVSASVLGSPIVYYALVVPTMAHGPTFAAAASFLWAWDRARRQPSLAAWCVLGALLGLATLMRWQAATLALLVAPLAIQGLARRSVRPTWLLAGAAAGLVSFSPQLLAWRALYGRFLTIPQGEGFMDWSSPHLVDVLVSADHGLFAWTPLLLLGALGLILGLREDGLLFGGALTVFFATAWVNGGVYDWAAGDAFGARRFDLVVPLLALGLAVLTKDMASLLRRRPMLAPAAVLVFLVAWNLGQVVLVQRGQYPGAAPLERLASDQARLLRGGLQRAAFAVAGPRGSALVYKTLSGEYLYTRFNPGGTFALGNMEDVELRGAWSSRRRKPGEPAFRWALAPEACVRVPLDAPLDLRVAITARAPAEVQPQVMTVASNGRVVGSASVGTEWGESAFQVPAAALVPGENWLCLRFSREWPGEEGLRAAAAVATIQLP